MKTARLGKTGLKVSRIGMGGIPLTRPTEDESRKLEIREILAMPLKKALVVERALEENCEACYLKKYNKIREN